MTWVFGRERDMSCICKRSLARNEGFGLGLMRWYCPEHGLIQPDKEGNCKTVHAVQSPVRPAPKPSTLNQMERVYQMRFGIHHDG